VNNNTINNGNFIGGFGFPNDSLSFRTGGDLGNKGNISNFKKIEVRDALGNTGVIGNYLEMSVFEGIANTGEITGSFFITWFSARSASNFSLILSDGRTFVPSLVNRYELTQDFTDLINLTWLVEGFEDGEVRIQGQGCINVPGCIVIDGFDSNVVIEEPVLVSEPVNLKQIVDSPFIGRENIDVGEKVGKFQSGSGIILGADVETNTGALYKLIVETYNVDRDLRDQPGGERVFKSEFSASGTIEIQLPYLGAGGYYWRAIVEDEDGNQSEPIEFGGNGRSDTDFGLFEGFEPYPHGYKFPNRSPSPSVLTGSISINSETGERIIDEGSKVRILYKAFPELVDNPDKRYVHDVYEYLGLDNTRPGIFMGNCFGMAFSAASFFDRIPTFNRRYSKFVDSIGSKFVWDNDNLSESNILSRWDVYDDTLETILANQLYQYDTRYLDRKNNSINNQTPLDISEELSEGGQGTYILALYGKKDCILSRYFCGDVGHAVIPYKVEGNKIYVWDNNYPLVEGDVNNAYDQFITINEDGTWGAQSYNWNSFDQLGLVNIEEAYLSQTGLPIGLNGNDTVLTLSGNSDFLVTDSLGRTTGFSGSQIIQEIPNSEVLRPLNVLLSESDDFNSTWKQVYFPEKIRDLSIQVGGQLDEEYDLMIAGGDYYTKLEGVETSSGQVDSFISTRSNLQINFDDAKVGEYSLLVDDFQGTNTGTVYIEEAEIMPEVQQYSIDWVEVQTNSEDSVTYEIDSDGDGNYDMSETFPAIAQPAPPEEALDYKITLQNPKHIDFNETTNTYTCDPNRKNCKINFGIRKVSGKNLGNKNHVCSTDFGFGATAQDSTCNPRKVVFPTGTHTVRFNVASKDNPEDIIIKQVTVINPEKDIDFSIQLHNDKYISQRGEQYRCKGDKKKCYFNTKFLTPNGEKLSKALSCEISYSWGATQTKCNPKRILVPNGEHQITLRVYETKDPFNFIEKMITLRREYNKPIK
ncbi:hypothetical protein OAN96_00965, partial [Candidatus Gracilibacteria bacterium]|nr:hypothetical protein [Candidatus Gracilibacteria bacterium]